MYVLEKEYCVIVNFNVRNAFNSTKWNCILEVLKLMDIPKYIGLMRASYFSHRALLYDT